MLYFGLKFLHIIGAAVLLGTGAGIAFFMLMAHLGRNPAVIAGVSSIVTLSRWSRANESDFIHNRTSLFEKLRRCKRVCAHIGVDAGPALIHAQREAIKGS